MPHKGTYSYPNATADPGKPKFQGGGSTGKQTKFKSHKPAVLIKNEGTPRDKGVNR